MYRLLPFLCFLVLIYSCNSSKSTYNTSSSKSLDFGSPSVEQVVMSNDLFLIEEFATDSSYAFTQENPVMVGSHSAAHQRRFLNSIAGPENQTLTFERLGSCCFFYTKNGMIGDSGLLDMYEIDYKGLKNKVVMYINFYDSDTLKVPVGFKLKEL